MRARWLKPEFFTDKKIASMGPIVALVYQALWCMADDGGTAPCDPETVKGQMFYRWGAVGVPEITGALQHLSSIGRIVRFEAGDDVYATIVRWNAHQFVHKPSKFRYPQQSEGVAIPVPDQCGTSDGSGAALPISRHLDSKTPRHLDTYNPTPPKKAASDTRFDATWAIYPRRAGGNSRADARKAWSARVASGVDPDVLRAGTERYAAYCQATGKVGTEFVKTGQTFFGPSEHWTEPWFLPAIAIVGNGKPVGRADQNTANLAGWLAEKEAVHGE